jgi:hypothetical protein
VENPCAGKTAGISYGIIIGKFTSKSIRGYPSEEFARAIKSNQRKPE